MDSIYKRISKALGPLLMAAVLATGCSESAPPPDIIDLEEGRDPAVVHDRHQEAQDFNKGRGSIPQAAHQAAGAHVRDQAMKRSEPVAPAEANRTLVKKIRQRDRDMARLGASLYYNEIKDPPEDGAEKRTYSALLGAVDKGDRPTVKRWLEQYGPEDFVVLAGWMRAAEADSPAVARLFLEAGVDRETRFGNRTALELAARHGSREMVPWLLDQGCDLNNGRPLAEAAGAGDTALMKLLLARGAAVAGSPGDLSPLAYACHYGQLEAAKLLVEAGAPPTRSYRRLVAEKTPLSEAEAQRRDRWLAGEFVQRFDETGYRLLNQRGDFSVIPWQCVSDEMSGLTWLVKDDAGGLHDKDLYFNRSEDSGDCGPAPCDPLAYGERVNRETACGETDWRLPTLAELETLCYPHMAAAFPHWPGFLLWARRAPGAEIVLVNADGLLGRSRGGIPLGVVTGQVLLVRGEASPLPVPARQDFTVFGFE